MKIKRLNEQEKYWEIIGYDSPMSDYLSQCYGLWLEAEGLEPLSADEHDTENYTPEQKEFLSTFIKMWDIATNFEREYMDNGFEVKFNSKKYNI